MLLVNVALMLIAIILMIAAALLIGLVVPRNVCFAIACVCVAMIMYGAEAPRPAQVVLVFAALLLAWTGLYLWMTRREP